MTTTALVLGAGVGMLLGLTGAGGGMLAVPALVVGMGYTVADARPVALVAIGLAALVGCIEGWRRGLVRYRAALWMAAAGIACAPLGGWLAHRLPDRMASLLFGLLLAVLALRMLRAGARGGEDMPGRDCGCELDAASGRFRWTPRCAGTLTAIGAAAGMLTGLFGVGGGFVIVPALRRVSPVGLQTGVATSLMVIAAVSCVSAAAMFVRQPSLAGAGSGFIVATVAGMLAGRFASRFIAPRSMRLAFAVAVLLAAAMMVMRALA